MQKTGEILAQLEKNKNINIQFSCHNEDFFKSIDALFAKLLAKMDMLYLLDYITTILREIIANAVKANAKRYYFKKIKIDINNPEEYAKGITNFKSKIIGKDTIENELAKTDYLVILSIELANDGIIIIVKNNSSIHPVEFERINLRIKKAKEYNDFTDAYDDIYDETEGAGLGIVLSILLLKNTGIGENSFSILSDKKTTKAKFTIPYELKPKTITTTIKEQILDEVDGLPSFNQNLLELLRLCKNKDTEIKEIVDKIIIDPALTSDILKLANSAGFFMGKKVKHISEAILIIGFSNLYDLLLVSSTRSILEKRYSKFHEIWNHCTKTAEYAKYIAQKFGKEKNAEFAYLGGLLHDLGKLILLATDSKFSNWISDLTKNRKIRSSTVLEEVSIGISHSMIGELMAKKWNFPDYLIEVIKYHHSPLDTNDKYKDFVFPAYLGNMLCQFETGKYNYYYLEETVLEKYKLFSRKDVDDLQKEIIHNSNGKI
ncbi:MAG: HDOD domain-containing protein [Spirochaetes bacterium]|nr:HDOD domain-containing protein [Spirochaetota bacterium]